MNRRLCDVIWSIIDGEFCVELVVKQTVLTNDDERYQVFRYVLDATESEKLRKLQLFYKGNYCGTFYFAPFEGVEGYPQGYTQAVDDGPMIPGETKGIILGSRFLLEKLGRNVTESWGLKGYEVFVHLIPRKYAKKYPDTNQGIKKIQDLMTEKMCLGDLLYSVVSVYSMVANIHHTITDVLGDKQLKKYTIIPANGKAQMYRQGERGVLYSDIKDACSYPDEKIPDKHDKFVMQMLRTPINCLPLYNWEMTVDIPISDEHYEKITL